MNDLFLKGAQASFLLPNENINYRLYSQSWLS